MALPRWVSRPDVDSPALLGAALLSASEDKEMWKAMGISDSLTIIRHRSAFGNPEELKGFRNIDCQGGALCRRCSEGRGGYVFRWLSPLWAQKYADTARPGAWRPEQGEDAPVPEGALGQRLNSEGQLL